MPACLPLSQTFPNVARVRRTLVLIALCLALLGAPACTQSASQPGGGTSVSTTPPTQAVVLTTDQSSYSPSSTIVVTITNRRQVSVFSMDHQSLCAVITLERLAETAWAPQRPCRLMSPTRIVEVVAGTTQITLAPGDAPWLVGTYRVVFHYALERGGDMSGAMVESAQFTVA